MGFFKNFSNQERSVTCADGLKVFGIDDNELIALDLYHAYWWDGKINFGDLIGPWLISLMTGKQVVNSKYLNITHSTFTVGSIIEHATYFPNQRATIWGSGLLRPLNNAQKIRKMRNADLDSFLAVRGMLTKKELSKLYSMDDNLPLGDPALLLPEFFLPSNLRVDNICIVPHFTHLHLFEAIKDSFNVINVMQYPQNVVNEIANAKVCISTSLHGVIIAQAYGVPWLLLRLEDQTLIGDMFKFSDFFSTIEEDKIAIKSLSSTDLSDLDFKKIATKAYLPKIKTNLGDLMSCFPSN